MKPFPDTKLIADLIQQLTGKQTALKRTRRTDMAQAGISTFAGVYCVDGESVPEALVLLDLAPALALAGALMILPAGVVLDALRTKRCDDELLSASVHEILNILAGTLNADGEPHLRLTDVKQVAGKFTGDVGAVLAHATQRLDCELCVAPCPPGLLSLARL